MQRRHALQLVGGAVFSVAGCVAANGPQTTQTETRTTQTKTETPDEDSGYELGDEILVDGLGTVAVESVTVRRSVIHHHLWRSLYEPVDAQMLVLAGRILDDADPEFDIQFDARIDGDIIESAERTWLSADDRIHTLSVPVDTVNEAAIVLRAGERSVWTLPDDVSNRIAVAPEFHHHDATILEIDDGTALDLTVENRGNRDGVFRGVAKHASAADADSGIRFPVPAGETVTETVQPSVLGSWPSSADFAHEISTDTRVFAVS